VAKTRELRLRLRALDRISKTLNRVKKRTSALGRTVKKASRAFAIFNVKTKKLRTSLNRVGGKMRSVGKGMTAGITAPVALAGAGFVRMAVRFQKSMNRVGALTRTIVKGKVDPAFNKLTETARKLGESTAFSASEASEAMGFLAQAGFQTDEILTSIKPTLDLAAAANLGLAETADIASNIMGGFQIEAKEMTRAADVLAITTATSNTNLEQLGEAMSTAAPIANKFGAELETTAALAGLLGNVGIQGSKAGTTLKAIFTKLAAPTATATKMMKALGVSVSDSSGNMRDINDILKDLAPALGNLPQKAQLKVINELFGLRGIAGASELLTKAMAEGKNPIEVFTETLQNSKGAAADMADTMLRGAPGAFARFRSAFESMAISIVESGFLDFITKIVKKLTSLFATISKTNPALLKWGTILVGIAAILGPIIFSIGLFISGLSKLIVVWSALKVIGAVLLPVIGAISLKFVLIAAVVGGVIFAVVRLIQKWDEMVSAFKKGKGIFDGLKRAGKIFLGIETEEPEEKQRKRGKLGGALGADSVLKQTREARPQEQRVGGVLDINFRGAPEGTSARAQQDGPLVLNPGFAGGVQ